MTSTEIVILIGKEAAVIHTTPPRPSSSSVVGVKCACCESGELIAWFPFTQAINQKLDEKWVSVMSPGFPRNKK